MAEVWTAYWPIVLVALAIGLITGYLLLRPRQRVRLTDSAPVRPHMPPPNRGGEGKGLSDEIAAATSDVAGQMLGSKVHSHLPGASGPPDNLEQLKGVGPKLAAMLNAMGIIRFDQLARLSDAEIERIDATLGAFRGRLARDKVVAQADYLARGDVDGFEQRFGKL
jgi:predicted flap endonuclease-1-like 5' DNA nuclease